MTDRCDVIQLTRVITQMDLTMGHLRAISGHDAVTPEESEIIQCATMLLDRARSRTYARCMDAMDLMDAGRDEE